MCGFLTAVRWGVPHDGVHDRSEKDLCVPSHLCEGEKRGYHDVIILCKIKLRRRLREIYRTNEHRLADGYDVVIVGRVRSREAKYGVLESDFLSLCGRLGILNE